MKSNGPHIIGLGAGRAGTTYVYEYLKQHPQVCMSAIKELSFFSSKIGLSEVEYQKYLENFDFKSGMVVGEISPSYIWPQILDNGVTELEVFRNMKRHLPLDTILFLVLRSPAARAYSQFLFEVKEGVIRTNCFLEELRKGKDSEFAFVGCTFLADAIELMYHELRDYEIVTLVNEIDLGGAESLGLKKISSILNIEVMGFDANAKINTTKKTELYIPEHESLKVLLDGANLPPSDETSAKWLEIKPGYVYIKTGWHLWNKMLGPFSRSELEEYRLLQEFISEGMSREMEVQINLEIYRDEIEKTQKSTGIDLSLWT